MGQCSPPRSARDAPRTCAASIQWRWHLDEAFVKINGEPCYFWRAVDHEGEVLEAVGAHHKTGAMSVACDLRSPLRPGAPPFCDGLHERSNLDEVFGISGETTEDQETFEEAEF